MEMEMKTEAEAEMKTEAEAEMTIDGISPRNLMSKSLKTFISFHMTRRGDRIRRKIRRGIDPEDGRAYDVVLDCCTLLVQLDNVIIAKYYGPIRQHFSPFFPELASIVATPTSYMEVAWQIIRNNLTFLDASLLRLQQDGHLTPSMVTTMAAIRSSIARRPPTLGREVRENIMEASWQANRTNGLRNKLYLFLDAPIALLAPNLSALLASTLLAARLIGAAGGLRELSNMPVPAILSLSAAVNCTIDNPLDELLPSPKAPTPVIQYAQQHHHHQVADILGQPYLGQADIFRNTPPRLQDQACYRLAEAINLAATMDLTGQATGEKGQAMGEEIHRMIQDWKQEDSAMLMELRAQITERPKKKLSVSKDPTKFKPKEEEKGKHYTSRDHRRERRVLASLEQWGLTGRSPSAN